MNVLVCVGGEEFMESRQFKQAAVNLFLLFCSERLYVDCFVEIFTTGVVNKNDWSHNGP